MSSGLRQVPGPQAGPLVELVVSEETVVESVMEQHASPVATEHIVLYGPGRDGKVVGGIDPSVPVVRFPEDHKVGIISREFAIRDGEEPIGPEDVLAGDGQPHTIEGAIADSDLAIGGR